jgi:hypothetical protein
LRAIVCTCPAVVATDLRLGEAARGREGGERDGGGGRDVMRTQLAHCTRMRFVCTNTHWHVRVQQCRFYWVDLHEGENYLGCASFTWESDTKDCHLCTVGVVCGCARALAFLCGWNPSHPSHRSFVSVWLADRGAWPVCPRAGKQEQILLTSHILPPVCVGAGMNLGGCMDVFCQAIPPTRLTSR